MDRLAMLQKMVESRPSDPFPRYGLAMELRKAGRTEEARQVFGQLVEEHPGYVATYLMFGNLLAEIGEHETAATIYARGIEAARQAGDTHAASELEAARAGLA